MTMARNSGNIWDKLGMGRHDEPPKKEMAREAARLSPELEARFERTLKNNYDHIPLGCNFASDINGVKSITMLKPIRGGKTMQLVIFREVGGRQVSETVSVMPDGVIAGPLPRELARITSKEQLMHEVLKFAEKLDINFWIETDQDIFPAEAGQERTTQLTGGEKKEQTVLNDTALERIEYMKQKGMAFGFVNKVKGGFDGYHGFVSPFGFVVMEHPKVGNAAYIIDNIPRLEGALSRDEKEAFIKRALAGELGLSRKMHRATGTTVIDHRGTEADWKAKISAEINKRTPSEKESAV